MVVLRIILLLDKRWRQQDSEVRRSLSAEKKAGVSRTNTSDKYRVQIFFIIMYGITMESIHMHGLCCRYKLSCMMYISEFWP